MLYIVYIGEVNHIRIRNVKRLTGCEETLTFKALAVSRIFKLRNKVFCFIEIRYTRSFGFIESIR